MPGAAELLSAFLVLCGITGGVSFFMSIARRNGVIETQIENLGKDVTESVKELKDHKIEHLKILRNVDIRLDSHDQRLTHNETQISMLLRILGRRGSDRSHEGGNEQRTVETHGETLITNSPESDPVATADAEDEMRRMLRGSDQFPAEDL